MDRVIQCGGKRERPALVGSGRPREKDEVAHREVAEAMQGVDRDGNDDVCVFAEDQRTVEE